jgi:hypothetical protein
MYTTLKSQTVGTLYADLVCTLSHYKGYFLWLETPFFPLAQDDRKRVLFFLKYHALIRQHSEFDGTLKRVLESCKAAIAAVENEKGRPFYKQWLTHELITIARKYRLSPAVIHLLKIQS